MEITKTGVSVAQNLQFTTIRGFEEYAVVTMPLDCVIEIKNNFIHIRKRDKSDENTN